MYNSGNIRVKGVSAREHKVLIEMTMEQKGMIYMWKVCGNFGKFVAVMRLYIGIE